MSYRDLDVKRFTFLLTSLVNILAMTTVSFGAASSPVEEIAPGIFVAQGAVALASPANRGAIANRVFVVGEEAVAVIDTGGSFANGEALRAAIRERTQLPIRYVINTHMHPDHVLGNAAFRQDGALFVGHYKLPRALSARAQQYLQANRALIGEGFAGTEIVPPTILIQEQMSLDLGHRMLRLTAHATAHTDNDLTVLDERTGTLILGDLLFKDHLPAIDGSLNGWIAVLERLMQQPARQVVPGHGPASLPWPQGGEDQRRYLTALRSDLRGAVRTGWPLAKAMDNIPVHEPEHWGLIDAFHKRNISAAYGEMEWE